MGSFVDSYYSVHKFQAAYAGIISNITDRNQWPEVDKGFKLHSPCQKKREAGRLRKNRIKPVREIGDKATRQVRCPNYKEYGHRAGSWKCSLTRTKKRCLLCSFMSSVNLYSFAILKSYHIICRKRTNKTNVKVGRKKAKKAIGGDEAIGTPRIRGALAREATAKGKREAAVELKAAAAREAAARVKGPCVVLVIE